MSWGVATQNGVSVSLASIVSLSSGVTDAAPFTPADLFVGGIIGTWYDPSDFTTLFQDSAGTTPVTAVEQPVGKMLDKSGNANHATQATAASRPVLKALYNILTGTATLATQSVTTRAASYKLSFSGAGTVTLSGTGTGTFSAGTNTVTCTAGTLTVTVSGAVTSADLRLSIDATGKMPAYQDVVTSTSYDTVGFFPYLSFDGTDDSMSTGSINFSATDKMSVFAGVTKLSDAASSILCELSTNSQVAVGSFAIWAPVNPASPDYAPYLFGTAGSFYTATSFPAPKTNVVDTVFDIGGAVRADEIKPRVNAAIPTLTNGGNASAGTGNFGTYSFFIGRRNNSSLPYNGRVYSLIVAGKQASSTEVSNTETWVNGKTGAY